MALNLGTVLFNLGANTQGLQKAVQEIEKLRAASDKLVGSASKSAAKTSEGYLKQEQAAIRATRAVLQLNRRAQELGAGADVTGANTDALNEYIKIVTASKVSAAALARAQQDFNLTLDVTRQKLDDLKSSQTRVQKQQSAAARARGAFSAVEGRAAAAGVDPSALGPARSALVAYEALLQNTETSTADLAAAQQAFKNALAGVSTAIQSQKTSITQLDKQAGAAARAQRSLESLRQKGAALGADTAIFAGATAAVEDFAQKMSTGALSSKDFSEAQKEVQAALSAAQAQLQALSKQKGLDALLASRESAISKAQEQVLGLNQKISAAGGSPNLINANNAALQALSATLRNTSASTADVTRAQTQFNASLGASRRALTDHKRVTSQVIDPTTKLGTVIKELQSVSVLALGPLSGLGSRILAVGSIAQRASLSIAVLAGTLVGAGLGLAAMVKSSITTTREMERIQNSLKVSAAGAVLAARQFNFVADVADEMGISLKESATRFADLQAAAIGTSLTNEELKTTFKGVAAASSVFDFSAEKTQQVMQALVEMLNRGNVSMEELNKQFAQKIPGGLDIAAKAMKMTRGELVALVSTGGLDSAELIRNLGPELLARFGDAAKVAAGDFESSMNRMQNAIFMFSRAFDEITGASNAVKAVINAVTGALKTLTNNMTTIAGVLGTLAGAFAGLILPRVLKFLAGLVYIIGTSLVFSALRAIEVIGALNLAFAASPIGVIAFFAKLILMLGGAIIGYQKFTAASERVANETRMLANEATDFINKLEDLNSETSRTALTYRAELLTSLEEVRKKQQEAAEEMKNLGTEQQALTRFVIFGTLSYLKYRLGLSAAQEKIQELAKDEAALAQSLEGVEGKLAAFDNGMLLKLSEEGIKASKSIAELVTEVNTYQGALRAIVGGASQEAVQHLLDLAEARKKLGEASPKDLEILAEQLARAKIEAGTTVEGVAELIRYLRLAKESTDDFFDSFSRSKKAEADISSLVREFQTYTAATKAMKGGASREAVQFILELADAQEDLTGITEDSRAAMVQALEQIGMGALAHQDLAAAVANTRLANERMNSSLQDYMKPGEDYSALLSDLRYKIDSLRKSTLAMAEGPDAFKDFESAQGIQDEIRATTKSLQDAGVPTKIITALIGELSAALRDNGEASKALEALNEQLQRIEQASDGVKGLAEDLRALAQANRAQAGGADWVTVLGINSLHEASKAFKDLTEQDIPRLNQALGTQFASVEQVKQAFAGMQSAMSIEQEFQQILSDSVSEIDKVNQAYDRRIQVIRATLGASVQAEALIQGQQVKRIKELEELAKKSQDSMTEYALQAARNIQDAFSEFLYDPFADGMQGMLFQFVDFLHKATSEALAAKLGEKLFGDTKEGKLGGFAGGILDTIFGDGKKSPEQQAVEAAKSATGLGAEQAATAAAAAQITGAGTAFAAVVTGVSTGLTTAGITTSQAIISAGTILAQQVTAAAGALAGAAGASSASSGLSSFAAISGGIPMFHNAGIINQSTGGKGLPGTRSDERLILGQVGEEVIRRDDPRHSLNGGGINNGGGGNNSQQALGVTIVNVMDPGVVGNYLATSAGRKLLVNVIREERKAMGLGG